jgi:polysaccharide export outer membrane protein
MTRLRSPHTRGSRDRRGARWAARAILVVLLAGSGARFGWAQSPAPADPNLESSDYLIAAGDLLQVFVWKEPELTSEALVRLDGKISVPLLGDIAAAGRTPPQLARELTSRLTRFVEAPQVTVSLKDARSARVFVVGQVNRAGEFPLGTRLTFLQALALAGGFGPYAKQDRILIVRQGPDASRTITVDYKKLEAGSDMSLNVVLRPGDTIVVP